MTTFAELKVAAAAKLQDPDNQVFTAVLLGPMCNSAFAEVGRIAPLRFTEDITPIADTLEYQLQASRFEDETPEIEVRRVEVWDASTTPDTMIRLVQPLREQPIPMSAAGWEVWNGVLRLPNSLVDWIDPDVHFIKVQGWCPFPEVTDDDAVLDLSFEQRQAVLSFVRVEALQALLADRDLFTQWQARTNNTDITPGALHVQLAGAEEQWRHRARQLAVLRD